MEEKSKILALLDDDTNTSLWLMPALEIPEHILRQMGFVNAFLGDKDRFYKEDGVIRLTCLFKPRARAMFETHLKDMEDEGMVLDEYDYPQGYVVLTLKFPMRYKKDYELFLQGKYSKFSTEFKKIFPEKSKSYQDGKFDYSLYFHIFKRTPGMREFLEDDMGIEIDKTDTTMEYWGLYSTDREELQIIRYLKEELHEN